MGCEIVEPIGVFLCFCNTLTAAPLVRQDCNIGVQALQHSRARMLPTRHRRVVPGHGHSLILGLEWQEAMAEGGMLLRIQCAWHQYHLHDVKDSNGWYRKSSMP